MNGSYVCGHCGARTAQAAVTNLENNPYPRVGSVPWRVLRCASCGLFTVHGNGAASQLFFPPEGRRLVDNLEKVPEPIAIDYREAVRCLTGGSHKAAAVMARRAVQGVCLDLGAEPGRRLMDQIESLNEKGELTNRLTELAHRVRAIGNDGAHPREDGLDEMTAEEAAEGVAFVEHLLQHVYII